MTPIHAHRPNLLIVEDSSTQRELLRHILEENGYAVSLAENGKQALEILRTDRPAAIISDVLMPEVDGYALCRAIKAEPRWRDLPVLLLTALSEPKDVIRGLECGADDFVVKPYDANYLLARVEHVLSNSELLRQQPPDAKPEILIEGQKFVIDADRRQILNLLLSTYEAVVRRNKELLKAQDELNRLNEELEAKVKARTAALTETNEHLETFVYSVAHDLRAPLRGMQAFSQALLEDYSQALDAMGRDFAQRICVAAERMTRLVNELLEFSHLSRLELGLEPLDLRESVKNVLAQMQTEIQERDALVEVNGACPIVCASPTLLESVLTNLLSNAVKFVPSDVRPRVQVAAEDRGRMVRVWVRDNGIGIDPEFHEQIFGVFQRLHSQEAYEGTGIGLAIVKKAVERMGGTVGVESQSGSGSAFWFELPREQSATGADSERGDLGGEGSGFSECLQRQVSDI